MLNYIVDCVKAFTSLNADIIKITLCNEHEHGNKRYRTFKMIFFSTDVYNVSLWLLHFTHMFHFSLIRSTAMCYLTNHLLKRKLHLSPLTSAKAASESKHIHCLSLRDLFVYAFIRSSHDTITGITYLTVYLDICPCVRVTGRSSTK